MSASESTEFIFRHLDRIGSTDAEGDDEFLGKAFVRTDFVQVAADCRDDRSIIVGRTGAGKSALLWRIQNASEHCCALEPESLAINHIANSTILAFLAGLDVRIDLFYRLLWRHLVAVEALRLRFGLRTESDTLSLRDRASKVWSAKNKKALDYLERWGSSFWLESDVRIKEVVSTMEQQLSAGFAETMQVPFSANATLELSETKRSEIAARCQQIIDRGQARELSGIVDMVKGVLDDRQQKFYLTIDKLDEDWVDDQQRNRLIRALVETVRAFRPVRNLKILVALRRDLLDRVVRQTRDKGFQEEKYRNLILPVMWTDSQLFELIDSRIRTLVKQRYTRKSVGLRELFPPSVGGQKPERYIIARTLRTPRDAIAFVNAAIAEATDSARIDARALKEAEGNYSRLRVRALADEWYASLPSLMHLVTILKKRPASFPVSDFTDDDLDQLSTRMHDDPALPQTDPILVELSRYLERGRSTDDLRFEIIHWLYQVGAIGIRLEGMKKTRWVESEQVTISSAEISDRSIVEIHRAFWRVWGTKPPAGKRGRRR